MPMARTLARILPVMASINPKLNIPPAMASFSITSKKLKKEV